MTRGLLMVALAILAIACVGRPADVATGEEIYLQLCSNCHGADLSGGLGSPLGPGSKAAEQSDEFLRVSTAEGRGRMPSFRTILDDDQMDRLIAYLRVEQDQ